MLLTSSQVSVAVSSGVVIICTFALFLSGYVLQQRTLRDLRAAIRTPEPSPKIFLPDRFKQQTTELPDGTIVILDDNDGGTGSNKEPVVEVRPSVPGNTGNQKPLSKKQQGAKATNKRKGSSKKGGKSAGKDGDEAPQKPMSRAERRRRIKEEIMQMAQEEDRGRPGYLQRRRLGAVE